MLDIFTSVMLNVLPVFFWQLVDAEQKSMDLGNDVGILTKMMNSREGSLSITKNDLGWVCFDPKYFYLFKYYREKWRYIKYYNYNLSKIIRKNENI